MLIQFIRVYVLSINQLSNMVLISLLAGADLGIICHPWLTSIVTLSYNFVRLSYYSSEFTYWLNHVFNKSFSPIEIKISNKYFLYPIEVIDFVSSIVKRCFTSNYFFQSSGGWKLPNLSCSGLNYARFEEFIHNAESLTRIIYALRIIPHNKIVPKWIEAT